MNAFADKAEVTLKELAQQMDPKLVLVGASLTGADTFEHDRESFDTYTV